MKKNFSIELIEEPKTLADYDFNELKLNALICELERDILSLRLKKLVLMNERAKQEIPVSSHSSNEAPKTLWGKVKSFFVRTK